MRKQCLIMARNNHTSAFSWLSLPLFEFRLWIAANNALVAEEEKERRHGK